MEITLEAVEKVMEQAGVEYAAAKEALQKAEGDVEEAIRLIRQETGESREDIKSIMAKLKKMVEKGNVDRILIRKGEEVVLNIPVNVGILGGVLGLAAAPWALIAGTIAAFGLGCRIEVVHKDGTTDEV
ncbi:MAG: DUF4342 domain-containing protein [Lachnospiraceae bacterium]|nr:DUF4342 domain-containing protein [Lachnospiraceae bacterium]MBR3641991.1 DUF4342 domain-containing protein [Parasporobacterium sp.]